jgi:hypothetical protein
MQTRYIGIGLLALLALGTLWFVIGGLSQGPKELPDPKSHAEAELKDDEGGPSKATLVKREEGLRAESATPDAANLALPGELPTLKGVATGGIAVPAQPHGVLEVEGDVQEADAEKAIQAVFPAIRNCYSELRQRAPQARGRMLMKFAIKPGAEAGQAALGELFLKETQFTDPTYLTCVRAAIDATKFPVGKSLTGAVTVPLFLTPEDAGEPPAAAK